MVDLIIAGDLHAGNLSPECRSDCYIDALLHKLKWIGELQEQYDVPIIFPGDIFDHWSGGGTEIINKVIAAWPKGIVYTVPGQRHSSKRADDGGRVEYEHSEYHTGSSGASMASSEAPSVISILDGTRTPAESRSRRRHFTSHARAALLSRSNSTMMRHLPRRFSKSLHLRQDPLMDSM